MACRFYACTICWKGNTVGSKQSSGFLDDARAILLYKWWCFVVNQNASGHGSGQPALGGTVWVGEYDKMSLLNTIILQFYDSVGMTITSCEFTWSTVYK